MTTNDLHNARVPCWREQRRLKMGFDPELACQVALTTVDLHELERGCPPPIAVALLR